MTHMRSHGIFVSNFRLRDTWNVALESFSFFLSLRAGRKPMRAAQPEGRSQLGKAGRLQPHRRFRVCSVVCDRRTLPAVIDRHYSGTLDLGIQLRRSLLFLEFQVFLGRIHAAVDVKLAVDAANMGPHGIDLNLE